MDINKVSLIGLGALGVMYANHMSNHLTKENLRIIADEARIMRYHHEGIYCNGKACDFNYVTPEEAVEPADLLIVTVKYNHLQQTIQDMAGHIGPDTIILSALNGVVSEQEIGEVYGHDHNLYCVAQGMDAVKVGNEMTYKSMGILCFGELDEDEHSDKVSAVKNFFDAIHMPYEINNKMSVKLWSKLMANVGINQTVAYYGKTTGEVQKPGPARDMMIAAMEETLAVAKAEGIAMTRADIDYWMPIIDGLNPDSMPSMAQDMKAKRPSEVALFSGTIIRLAEKHSLDVPVNTKLYQWITGTESKYLS